MSLFPFDDAKVRRILKPAMTFYQILLKNHCSFDVNQETVFVHSPPPELFLFFFVFAVTSYVSH